MNCEKCQQPLPGATATCRNCGNSIARNRIGEWRNKRDQILNPRTGRLRSSDSTVVRFQLPAERQMPAEPAEAPIPEDLPPWRRQVIEKVREVREQRKHGEAAARTHARHTDDVNPIVEAAIRRIRRDAPPASALVGSGAQATARALAYEEKPQTPTTTKTNPAAAPAPVTAPGADSPARPQTKTTARENQLSTEIIQVSRLIRSASEPQTRKSDEATDKSPQTTDVVPQTLSHDQIVAEPVTDEAVRIAEDSEETVHPVIKPGSTGPAPLLARGAAAIIDLEVVAFSFLPFFTAFALFNAELTRGTLYLLITLSLLLTFLYHLVMTAVAGRTLGMAVFRIRIADADEGSRRLSWSQSARRATGAVLALVLLPLNLFAIALSPERQSLPDQFSGTMVVRQ